MKKRTWKELDAVTGGLSGPDKMPCHTWSIGADKCITGGKLRDIPDSPCSSCYAFERGHYVMPNVKTARARTFEAYHRNPSAWVDAMVDSIRKTRNPYFRWFDSGDLQSVGMLACIARIARELPEVRFWLPTQERRIVRAWVRSGGIRPANLIIRVSSTKLNQRQPVPGFADSMVSTTGTAPDGVSLCPAPSQGNKCRDCRKCWTPDPVAYNAH